MEEYGQRVGGVGVGVGVGVGGMATWVKKPLVWGEISGYKARILGND